MLRGRRGQTGETLTWIVATLVVIVVLLLTIYVALVLSKTKGLGIGDLKTDNEESFLEMKTSLAHKAAGNDNKNAIDDFLEDENES